MNRRAAAVSCILATLLLLCAPAGAQTNKNPQLSAYAKQRSRAQNGRFVAVPSGQRAIRMPLAGSGLANPSSTGKSQASIAFQPATSKRPGSLSVVIPEYYMGTTLGGTANARQLFTQDLQRRTAVVNGTLTLGRHSPYTSFGRAEYKGTIAPGTSLSPDGLKRALEGLFVNPLSVQLKPAR